jgi:hypothetical protein
MSQMFEMSTTSVNALLITTSVLWEADHTILIPLVDELLVLVLHMDFRWPSTHSCRLTVPLSLKVASSEQTMKSLTKFHSTIWIVLSSLHGAVLVRTFSTSHVAVNLFTMYSHYCCSYGFNNAITNVCSIHVIVYDCLYWET